MKYHEQTVDGLKNVTIADGFAEANVLVISHTSSFVGVWFQINMLLLYDVKHNGFVIIMFLQRLRGRHLNSSKKSRKHEQVLFLENVSSIIFYTFVQVCIYHVYRVVRFSPLADFTP